MSLRDLIIPVALVLLVGVAGCLGSDEVAEEPGEEIAADSIQEDDVVVPQDAQFVSLEDGYRLAWDEVETPFEQEITIPENTVGVTAEATVETDAPVWVNITRTETGVERCTSPLMDSYVDPVHTFTRCSSLASQDDLPASWTMTVEANADIAEEVHLDLEAYLPDGLIEGLDLDQVSIPEHDVLNPEPVRVESEDGTSLHADVTRPDVDEPVPVVLITDVPATEQAQQAQDLAESFDPEPFTKELAARGFAVVQADARGTGQSGGCLDLWGQADRLDQHALIAWAADQDWSQDKVASMGLGYSATLALTGAVDAPDALETVIAFGAVTNPYDSWHFGGVPNGDGFATPLQAQTVGALGFTGAENPLAPLTGTETCDNAQYADLLDPRAVYNTFYEVRDLPEHADDIDVPIFYGQGLHDPAAKGSMALDMIHETQDDALALVGPWADQFPARADAHMLTQAWLDEHLLEAEIGIAALVGTSSITQPSLDPEATIADTMRTADTWPPMEPDVRALYPDFDQGTLSQEPVDGEATVLLDPVGATFETGTSDDTLLELEGTVQEDLLVTGAPLLNVVAEVQGVENAFLSANVYVEDGGERELLTMGMANLAHHQGHDQYTPLVPLDITEMGMPMEPVEQLIPEGATLTIEIRSTTTTDWTLVQPGRTGALVLEGGAEGMVFELPTTPLDDVEDVPRTVSP